MKPTTRAPRSGEPGPDRAPAANCLDIPADLADLRCHWGEAYRITWDNGQFRATHIISGDTLDAENAADLQHLIRHHYTAQATSSGTRVSGYQQRPQAGGA